MAIDSAQWFEINQGKIRKITVEEVPEEFKSRSLRRFKTEGQMTELLLEHPDVIENGLMVVRADPVGSGGADLIGITLDGQILVVEMKRGTINTSTLGQAFGYALEAEKWPKNGYLLSKMKHWQIRDIGELCRRIDNGAKSDALPVIVVVGNNVTGSILEMAKYMSENSFSGKKMDIRILSVGFWEKGAEGDGYVCRRIQKMENGQPVNWKELKQGDILQSINWLDTDGSDVPYYVVGYAEDGQTIVRKTKRNKQGKILPCGEEMLVPFLVNYKRVQ